MDIVDLICNGTATSYQMERAKWFHTCDITKKRIWPFQRIYIKTTLTFFSKETGDDEELNVEVFIMSPAGFVIEKLAGRVKEEDCEWLRQN